MSKYRPHFMFGLAAILISPLSAYPANDEGVVTVAIDGPTRTDAEGSSDRPGTDAPQPREDWIDRPQDQWPQIAMINNIQYVGNSFEVAGCGFLLDNGTEIFAVTAKHVLTYFKSEKMDSVCFGDTLKSWTMYPKNRPKDAVIVDRLINEDPDEPLDGLPPAKKDWLIFSIKKRSNNIQPLKFRTGKLQPGEKVFIVGWRYTDKDCTQRVYEGKVVRLLDGSFLVSTVVLADNTMPGLSGAPVIDSGGHLIGLMCRKAGKMEEPSSTEYPRRILAEATDSTPAP